MLERFLEQKKVTIGLSLFISLKSTLSSNEWITVETLVDILKVFHKATLELSSET